MSRMEIPESSRKSHAQGTPADDRDDTFEVGMVCRPRRPLPSVDELCQRQLDGVPALSYDEYADRYGADHQELAAIRKFAEDAGLEHRLSDTSVGVVALTGTAKALREAFATDLKVLDDGTHRFLSHTAPLSVPAELQPFVSWIYGLSRQSSVARSRLHMDKASHEASEGATPSFTSAELAAIYDYPGLDGAGQCVGIIELAGGYRQADVDAYLDLLEVQRRPEIVNVGPNQTRDVLSDLEVTMDVQLIASLVGGAKLVVYNAASKTYSLQDYHQIFARAIFDRVNRPKVLSNSWSWPELASSGLSKGELRGFDRLFKSAALLGITICSSSGDAGAMVPVDPNKSGEPTSLARVNFPASNPLVLSCGGTSVRPGGPGGAAVGSDASDEVDEWVWNSLAETLSIEQHAGEHATTTLGNGMASTGGVSLYYPMPAFQREAKVPRQVRRSWTNGRLTTPETFAGRGVPDVAANADLNTGYVFIFNGGQVIGGGTSASAPMWAALMTQLNAGLQRPCGFIAPVLYAMQGGQGGLLRQIVRGGNGAYHAKEGLWNACSGLGVPRGAALLAALSGRDDDIAAANSASSSSSSNDDHDHDHDHDHDNENSMSNSTETQKPSKYLSGHDWGRIMAHAWRDPDFKQRLEADPTATIKRYIAETWSDRDVDDYNIFSIHDAPDDLSDDHVNEIADGTKQVYHCSDLC